MSTKITLSQDEEVAVFAALCAMVEDVHAPQDQMSDDQWKSARDLFHRIEARLNQDKVG